MTTPHYAGPLSGIRILELASIGPDECLTRNPRLIYARMTGWGQTGPRAHTAGHDINDLSITGALHAMGTPEDPPFPPLNAVADVAGGSMLLVTGVLGALVDRAWTGQGQIVDVAMVDGVSVGMQMLWALRAQGPFQTRTTEPSTGVKGSAAMLYGYANCPRRCCRISCAWATVRPRPHPR